MTNNVSWARRGVVWCAVVAMSGCASVATTPSTARLTVPQAWQQSSTPPGDDVAVVSGALWWTALGDAELNSLIDQALARNNDLAQAAVRVRRAQLVAGQAASDQLPEVSVRGNASTSEPLSSGARSTRSYGATASVSWELDLWGRLAANQQAAELEAQATQADRDAAALSLSATVARLYWQLGYLNQRVVVSEQSIDYARETLRLVRAQYEAGAASGLEMAQATQSLAPLVPLRRFVANVDRTGGFVLSPDGRGLLWSQTVGTDVGLAVRSVQLMVDRNELEAWKTPGGHRRISRASVEQWINARTGASGKAAAATQATAHAA